jgi:hypothetical protein
MGNNNAITRHFTTLAILSYCILSAGCVEILYVNVAGSPDDLTFGIQKGLESRKTKKRIIVELSVLKLGVEGPLGSDAKIVWQIEGEIKTSRVKYGQIIKNMKTIVEAEPLDDGEYRIAIRAFTPVMKLYCTGGAHFTISHGRVFQGFTDEYIEKYYGANRSYPKKRVLHKGQVKNETLSL